MTKLQLLGFVGVTVVFGWAALRLLWEDGVFGSESSEEHDGG